MIKGCQLSLLTKHHCPRCWHASFSQWDTRDESKAPSFEVPKLPSEQKWGVSPPSPLGDMESRKLPQRVQGRAPANNVLAHFELKKVHLVTRNVHASANLSGIARLSLESRRNLPKVGRLACLKMVEKYQTKLMNTDRQCVCMKCPEFVSTIRSLWAEVFTTTSSSKTHRTVHLPMISCW